MPNTANPASKSSVTTVPIVGRLAPSPTGVLHVGNARSLVAAWLSARSTGGKVLLRIEDLLPGQPEKVATTLEDLAYLGLTWDDPPEDRSSRTVADFDVGADRWGRAELPGFWLQSARGPAYEELSHALIAAGMAYPCVCTRKDIERALRAPHREEKGRAYPGTCRGRFTDLADAVRWEGALASRLGRRPVGAALRMRVGREPKRFEDLMLGPQAIDVASDSGDFVIRRKDGLHAYMLAVVVDDIAMGVTEVVRGEDLLESTPRQALLLDDHYFERPSWAHVPLVTDAKGKRFAKRKDSLSLAALASGGLDPEVLVGWLASTFGPAVEEPLGGPRRAADLIEGFDLSRLPLSSVPFGLESRKALGLER